MASVSRCDSCGAIVNHNECVFIRVNEENSTGKMGKIAYQFEICTSCLAKSLVSVGVTEDGSK